MGKTDLGQSFARALSFAFEQHSSQRRKGSGVPYVAHLLGVCSLALEHGADENEAIAALLHDAVEDQGGAKMLHRIHQEFGEGVASIVEGCTDTDLQPKPPWRQRKEAYLAHLPQAPASVRLVSAADKVYNARSILRDYRQIGEEVWQRFRGGREGTLWYYRSLAALFVKLGPASLAAELERVVTELERLVSGA